MVIMLEMCEIIPQVANALLSVAGKHGSLTNERSNW
jgi:hypothetical protein